MPVMLLYFGFQKTSHWFSRSTTVSRVDHVASPTDAVC